MEEDFRLLVRRKMTESLAELNPLIEQITNILTAAYEKGFWCGLNIGLSVEPKVEEK